MNVAALFYTIHFSNKHTIEKMKKVKVDFYSKLHILYITVNGEIEYKIISI